jgi:LuxR family maltose regulon positive regulatory protein
MASAPSSWSTASSVAREPRRERELDRRIDRVKQLQADLCPGKRLTHARHMEGMPPTGQVGTGRMLLEASQALEACTDPGVLPELIARVEHRLRLVQSRGTRTPYEEDLSDRELAVLRLLATDLTQREIGEALYVSFNIIKSHVKSIFRKLDVATRLDAASRARELGLL